MHIAVHSNACGPSHGGGGVFIFAIAAALTQQHEVTLFLPAEFTADNVAAFFPASVTTERLHLRPVPKVTGPLRELRLALQDRRFDAVLRQDSHPPRFALNPRAAVLCEFPLVALDGWRNRKRLASYHTVLANSDYTAGWIRRRWGRQAHTLYPPVNAIPALVKEPWILGVGRFLGSRRNKRQLEMVEQFRGLCNNGLTGWELHLAGFVQDRDYLAKVQVAAAGLPVRFHTDVTRHELEQLYGQASLFWHAVGEGIAVDREPELMEHFGIVTVEAMSAGCVPVVFAGGGQPEIVGTDGQAGCLWPTVADWEASTMDLVRNRARRLAMSAAARQRATRFDTATFAARLASAWPLPRCA